MLPPKLNEGALVVGTLPNDGPAVLLLVALKLKDGAADDAAPKAVEVDAWAAPNAGGLLDEPKLGVAVLDPKVKPDEVLVPPKLKAPDGVDDGAPNVVEEGAAAGIPNAGAD